MGGWVGGVMWVERMGSTPLERMRALSFSSTSTCGGEGGWVVEFVS